MNNEEIRKKEEIESALAAMIDDDFLETSKNLLEVLDYHAPLTEELLETVDNFIHKFPAENENTKTEQEFRKSAKSIELVSQVGSDEIADSQPDRFESRTFDGGLIQSFVFCTVELKDKDYSRSKYAQFTREVNKRLPLATVVFFRVENRLTIGFVGRRQHKRDPNLDVLEQVTLIKDIHLDEPHRAHLDILFELSLPECAKWMVSKNQPENFDGLLTAWLTRLDTSELNKRFFNELANWYFWAVDQVRFPDDAGEDVEVRNATSVIRLLTRLIFVWFIKEKGLVPDALFNPEDLDGILENLDPQESTYYKAILQNLFFATLNQEMNTAQKPDNRKFRGERRQHYNITSLYRYKDYFIDPDDALRKFETIPFLNGGLFECLDGPSKEDATRILRVDGFSDRNDNPLHVPNELFFADGRTVDLNTAYDTKGKQYKVRGLLNILDRYKFTIAENTPIEEEVALDPELLGKVFENLLAAYNPETKTTARKQTGSYYTRREIVNYMTDESLVAYLKNEPIVRSEEQNIFSVTIPPSQLDLTGQADPVQTEFDVETVSLSDEQKAGIEEKLRGLLAYNDEPHEFNEAETETLIKAIDTLKILDPAVGSGAFPMGVLHKLVFILGRLDPRNEQWKQRQIDRVENTIKMAEEIDDSTFRESTLRDLEGEIESINEAFERNKLDYGRKLYLIENCIYGVDIQPIATQIAKLRFFISLIVDQQIDDSQDNRGVRPLPNLETKFVAANTLIGVDRPLQTQIRNPQIDRKERELADVRRRHFTARTPNTKAKYRELDARIRTEIGELLEGEGFPHETTEKIAHWDPYDQNASADFFDPEWMFNVRDGYDVAIGNPPYIQLQSEGGRLGRLYEPCNFDTFTRTGDIYCLFYEKANQLSKNGGHVCFITSNKWMRASYGKKLRNYFISHTQPIQLLDMGQDVFDATVNTNILLLQSTVPDVRLTFTAATIGSDFDTHTDNIAQYLRDNGVAMELPPEGEPWAILSLAQLVLKRKIKEVGKPLKDWDINISYGIKTGYNEAFVIDRETRDRLIAEHPSSAEVLKPFLRGRDVKRWQINFAEKYLIKIESSENREHPWSGQSAGEAERIFADAYPAIHTHLEIFRERLIGRHDQGNYFWELRSCAYWEEFEQTQIVWGNLAQSPQFAFADAGFYLSAPATMMVSDSKYLLGILNSRITRYLVSQSAAERQGGFLEFKPMYISPLPIPDPPENERISALVSQILDATDTDPGLEDEINQMVYLLYGLTDDEIAIVEGAETV